MSFLVTVYVVNHNYGRFLRKAMDSLLSQTYDNIEILLIDDGSTDGSGRLVESYDKYENVFPVLQSNKGLVITNNIALRLARGEYIMRLDADDYLDPNAISVLAAKLDRNPDVGLVFPDYYEVDEDGEVINLVRRHDFEKVELLDQPAHGACTLIRRKLLTEIGGYDEAFACQDGYDLWVRFIQKHRVANVNLPLFYYRRHGNSLTSDEKRLLETRHSIYRKFVKNNHHKISGLGIIPVKGSRFNPREMALETLGKKRLIDWTVECALACDSIEHVVVTTPDNRIQKYLRDRYGDLITVISRDRNLARANSYPDASIFDAMEKYSSNGHELPESIVVLPVEAPFRRPNQIDAALDVMRIFSADRVVSVRIETSTHYRHNGQGLQPLNAQRLLGLEAEALYRDAGLLQAAKTSFIKKSGELFGGRVGHIVADKRSSTLVLTKFDWVIAAKLAEDPVEI